MRSIYATLAIIAFASGCSQQELGADAMYTESTETKREEAGGPLRNLNPAPKAAFEIRISLDRAPGPFEKVEAAAQYDVVNPAECGAPQPVSGAIPRISSSEPVALTRISENEFVGIVYADRILDEDYYGRGTCRWRFIEARVGMRASADPLATSFIAAINADAVLRQAADVTFFSSVHYPNAEIDGYSTFGHDALDHVPAGSEGEYFEVEMSAKAVAP